MSPLISRLTTGLTYLVISVFLLCGICPAATVEAPRESYTLAPVVVSATRSLIPADQIAANVTVITAEEIERLPAASVAEVLQFVPGVFVDFQGGPGSDGGGLRIQGSETRHVAIYQDGVPLNQLANPRTDLASLPLGTIDRIEVHKGAASSAWGSSLGGVVNIITKQPDRRRAVTADVAASYGEHDTLRTRANVGGSLGRWGWLLAGTHEASDGFMAHAGYRQNSGYAKVDGDLGTIGSIDFAAFFGEGEDDQPLPNYAAFWDERRQRRNYQRLAWEATPTPALMLAAEVHHHRYDTRIDDVYADHRELYNDYRDDTWGGGGRAQWTPTAAHAIGAGFDAEWGEYDWFFYTDTYDTRNWAAWINDTATFGPLSINGGLRYDDNLDFGSEVSPSLGAVYRFARYDALIRAQVARGFSAPPAAWVNDPTYGNADLDAEVAVAYQLGGQIQPCRFFRAEVNLFRANVDDLITWEPVTERYQNVASVERQGVEGGLTALFDAGLTLYFGGSYVDVFDEQTDERIQDIPKVTYTARAQYTGDWLSHTLVGRYIDHNSSLAETRDRRFVWEYRLMARLPVPKAYGTCKLFVNLYNLTDSDYLYRTSRPKPGRWLEAGVQFIY